MSVNEDYEVKLARLAMILTMVEYKKAFESLSRDVHTLDVGIDMLYDQIDAVYSQSLEDGFDNKAAIKEFKKIAALAMRAMVEFGLKGKKSH